MAPFYIKILRNTFRHSSWLKNIRGGEGSVKMKIKQVLKRVLEFMFDSVGIEAMFCKKDKTRKAVVFDKNKLSFFYSPNKRMELYFKGLDRAEMRWSDNFSKQLRFYSLQQIVEYILSLRLDADFAECGCWKGHSSFIISTLLSRHGFKNQFHIFDSFEGGLSEKTAEDKNERYEQSTEEICREKVMFQSLEESVRQVLGEFDFVKLYKGWIPERFGEISGRKFSFVHIDVDLYEPTKDSLNFFFPKLINGGSIVIDDYGVTQFPGCKKAVDEFLRQNEYTFFYEMPLGGGFIIK
jgi:O-methyltransferase